jgi:hypothetical protein
VLDEQVLPTKGALFQIKVFWAALVALLTGANINKRRKQ